MNSTISDRAISAMIDALSDKMNPARDYECRQVFLRWRDEGFVGLTPDQQAKVVKAMNDYEVN